MTPILKLQGLRKAFGGNLVFDQFNLEVATGEILGLLGPNGSGKSTLLDTITGFTPLERGSVMLKGRPIEQLSAHDRAQAGMRRTFQLPSMPEKMTVLEVMLAAQPSHCGVWESLWRGPGLTRVERQGLERARGLLESLNLSAVANHSAQAISGGQKKLLGIGCALMGEPEILLLDEPTAGVHPNMRQHLVDILRKINASGITIIVVEHDMHFINLLCHRCVVLDRGELIANCAPGALASNPRVVQAYLGISAQVAAAPAGSAEIAAANAGSAQAVSAQPSQAGAAA